MEHTILKKHPVQTRYIHALVLCFALSILPAFSMPYTMPVISSTEVADSVNTRYTELANKSNVIWSSLVAIDIDSVLYSDSLQLFLDNETVSVYTTYNNTENGFYAHYSSSDNGTDVYLSILDNCIMGSIHAASGQYSLQSVSLNEVAIIKFGDTMIYEEPEMANSEIDSANDSDEYIRTSSGTPIIRVLFLYTDSAFRMMGSYQPNTKLKQVVYNYINNGNESFNNSNFDAHLQLAYIGPTNYKEANYSWNSVLQHFSGSSDGYMDEVHTLRDKYKADVCVLFQGKNNYCGEAKTIKANANTAFCIVHPSNGCNGKYTAVHEIGHLIGCRHNYSADANLIPYIYGHGYYHYIDGYSSISWRTMMAYGDDCGGSEYNCNRILYWSNPNIQYGGIATGTTNLENNARVWNERAETVAAFKNEENEINFTATDNNLLSLYESIKATSSISVGNGFEVQPGQTVEMCAPTIELLAGTYIKAGAKVLAHTNPSTSTPYPQFVSKRATEPAIEQAQTSISTTKFFRNGQLLIRQGNRVFTPSGIFGF